jgi:catechol 2,3-dioxygenase-like lactoylglutathione lyase family enzyme
MSKIKINTIHHQSMPMRDRSRALRFWRDLIGREIIPAQEGGDGLIWMQAQDGTMIHLVQRPPDDTPNIHTAFEVNDFDIALTTIKTAGYKIIKGPIERADGQKAFYVHDPEGNRIEFVTKSGLKPSNRIVDTDGYTREVT